MKTKLLLITIFSAALFADTFANHIRTALNLRMFDGRPISVMVDGVPRGTLAARQEILNLTPGIHRLKVYAMQPHSFGWHGSMTPVFRGNVEIFEGFASYAVIQRWNGLVVEDYEVLYVEPVSPPCSHPGHVPGYSPNPCGPQYPPGNNGFHGSNCSNTMGPGYDGWNGNSGWGTDFRSPMSQNDFRQLLQVIESKSFESTRQEIAMGAIERNYFTSEQVREMLNVFTFESTKIEVAKWVYGKVVDPDRYYTVYDAFTFESSIADLQASIR